MILRTSLSLLGFSLAIAGLGGTAGAAEKQFPATMMKNVKTDFQAKGDGVTDDTAAINLAIASGGVIYFPAGVYLVTDRIEWKDSGGGWKNYRSIQGEGKTSTVIKLKDKLPAYSDPMKPRAVIYTASQPTGDNSFDPETGAGNAAFTNSIFDIGVDTGKDNPGAVGIDYLANNFGAIRDVQVRSGDGKGSPGSR